MEILSRIRTLAADYHGESVVITLWPHPRFVLQPENMELRLLASLDEKIAMIEKQGIDNLIILPFDQNMANISYNWFVSEYLSKMIGAKHVVVGFNHHFGKDRKGSFENLQKIAKQHGIIAERLPQVIINDMRVSSSSIRTMLEEGRIASANESLGYPYFLQGKVIAGQKLGRTLGFPTANIQIDEPKKLMPRNGVYAVLARMGPHIYKGMMSIGTRPTIPNPYPSRTIEVHLLDFKEDIYNQVMKVALLEWLRCEKKFPSVEELKDQMKIDEQEVRKIFGTFSNLNQLI